MRNNCSKRDSSLLPESYRYVRGMLFFGGADDGDE
jgi:hypothetical protein